MRVNLRLYCMYVFRIFDQENAQLIRCVKKASRMYAIRDYSADAYRNHRIQSKIRNERAMLASTCLVAAMHFALTSFLQRNVMYTPAALSDFRCPEHPAEIGPHSYALFLN